MKERVDFNADPKLTAYALGELEGDERREVEAMLRNDAEAQRAVTEIRAMAAQLENAFAEEAQPEERTGESAHTPPAAKLERPLHRKVVHFPYWLIGTLAAAGFAVVVALREGLPTPSGHGVSSQQKVLYEFDAGASARIPTSPAAGAEGAAASSEEATAQTLPEIEARASQSALADRASAPTPPGENVAGVSLDLARTRTLETAPDVRTLDIQPRAKDPIIDPKNFETVPASPPKAVARMRKDNKKENAPQTASSTDASAQVETAEEIVVLSPFAVTTSIDGYHAANTTGGARRSEKKGALGQRKTASVYFGVNPAPGVRMNFRAERSPSGLIAAATSESYDYQPETDFVRVADHPLSTFSVDVDTASYANVRRFLRGGQRPPRDAVRIEELVNYFPYRYAAPAADQPFTAALEVASAPWNPEHRLVRIGLKAREISASARPPLNLVFLLDVSGSMNQPNKLPLVKHALRLLVDKLKPDDRVALVTYAGASGLALPSTPVGSKREILDALEALSPGGSTNGAMGIHLAYDIAKANFIAEGANRVILCTDGDFNVGITNRGDLVRLIEEKAKANVFLTVLGFGMDNLKDGTLEQLADKGNGQYGYIDTEAEARKLFVEQLSGTLVTVAKDVKIQVEFNPAQAIAYRLIGYENRALKKEDFANDAIDAGDVGSGHTVTALYEVIPAGGVVPTGSSTEPLKYQPTETKSAQRKASSSSNSELLTVKLRYKQPTGKTSSRLEFPLVDRGAEFATASDDFKFAAAVASFGMLLRESPHVGVATFDSVLEWSRGESGFDDAAEHYRSEFRELVQGTQKIFAN